MPAPKYPLPFGKYLLLERINVGGMAEVFKAKSFGVAGFERIVAVKRILPTLSQDDEFVTMFIDEARIVAHLTHQNIVPIYELGAAEGTFFISMEYVAGRDLRQILDFHKKIRKPMQIARACYVAARVCEALEYAHRKRDPAGKDLRIIHRDVTPQNVIISYEGEVKLCDFGIAKAASRASRTQVGVLKGKFAYMCPEQVRSQPTDRRADLFAVGIVFFEMLTGERLFLHDSDYQTLEAVREANVPPPSTLNPEIPPELDAVVLKLLAREPQDRYQWAADAHDDLQDFVMHEGRPFHGRHLRGWMQSTYEREIEIENAKLEEFMRLRLPEAEPDQTQPTQAPADHVASLPTMPIDFSDGTTGENVQVLGASSPVSSLFGEPEVLGSSKVATANPVSDDGLVVASADPVGGLQERIPRGDTASDEEPEEERTQYDAVAPDTFLEANETLFDDHTETVGGDEGYDGHISEARAQLLDALIAEGRIDVRSNDETIDAFDDSKNSHAPEIVDPTTTTEHPYPDGFDPDADDDDLDDQTAISPMAMLDHVEDAEGNRFGDEDSEEGTIEEQPLEDLLTADQTAQATIEAQPFELAMPMRATPSRQIREVRPGSRAAGGPLDPHAPAVRPVDSPSPTVRPVDPHAPAVHGFDPAPLTAPTPAPTVTKPPSAVQVITRDPLIVMLGFAAAGILVLAALAYLIFGRGGGEIASLQITTEPTQAVTVLLDGNVVGNQTPLEVPDIAIGQHTIELVAEGYRKYTQRFDVKVPKPHSMAVPLERLPAAGPAPTSTSTTATQETTARDSAAPKAATPTAVAVSAPSSSAPPESSAKPKKAPRKARPRARTARSSGTGKLVISTTPPGVSVAVDGKKTNQRTPIREGISLPAGPHVVMFEMENGRNYEFRVVVKADRTTRLIKVLR